ncbi:MAG: hypothetical protein HC858_09065 [Brachymonas sp.]|nr:hypothetical protein [Brachymonas sp.]
MNAPESALQPVLTELLNRENPAVRDAVLLQSRSLVWMRHLPTSRKIFGKDL